MYTKQEEFLSWLADVKGVVYEHCGQRDLKEHFDSFCEDYNTATMPSKKYYNIQAWHAAEQAKGRKKKVKTVERTSFDDDGDRQREIARGRAERQEDVVKVMAGAMKSDVGIVQDMREQDEQKFKMRTAYALGDTETARDINNTLDPSRVTAAEMKAQFGNYAPSLGAMKK